jgi:hypothetical protein
MKRWAEHKIRNTRGWVGIKDTNHEEAEHIIAWVRPKNSREVIDALNRLAKLPTKQDEKKS